jgi:hypothetical protein
MLASEVYVMAYGVNITIAIGITIIKIANCLNVAKVPIIVCIKFFSFYECLMKLGTIKEKKLIIDIMVMRHTYEHQKIYNVRWINGENNPANAMTKFGPNRALQQFITTNSLIMKL